MNENALLGKIEAAFPKWNKAGPFVPKSMPEDEFKALRSMLYQLDPELLPQAVGLILHDLVRHHESMTDLTILTVTQFLNAYYDADRWDAQRSQFSEYTGVNIGDLDRKNVQTTKDQDFRYFSRTQCLVIIEWLELAKTWPVYRCSQEECNDAIRYWKNKAESITT